jgi:gamma-glutamyltranspeptidase/glutathione hydrolase
VIDDEHVGGCFGRDQERPARAVYGRSMSLPEDATRAVARSTRGMVASPHALATAAGVAVLRRGGNAVDAAIATNAVLTVVYPASCGLGGDALWLVFEPATGEVIAYNGSGGASAALDAETLRARGLSEMPIRGPLAVTVPGAVRSWDDVGAAHGRLGLDELLAPAQTYAREGFVVTDVLAEYFALNAELLRADPDANALFMQRGAPRAGDVLRNEPLAATLGLVRERGVEAFYSGPVGEAIVATLQALGNPMTLADLAAQRTERTAPLALDWHGARVYAHPPNSHASVALLALGALAGDGAAGQVEWNHLAVEALKQSFDLRDAHFADPRSMARPASAWLAPEELARMRTRIDPDRASARTPKVDRGGTIAVVAVDSDGRAVSLIESLYMNFGSGIVARGTGVFLHNRGTYANLIPGHPNELGGGKRPLHTLSPGMLLRDGVPELVYGTMGGDGQPQTHVQLLHNVYERGLSVQAAVDAPRFVYGRDSDSAFADSVRVESRLDPEVIAGLLKRGHAVQVLGAFENALGHCHAIALDRGRGSLAGASDPRADSLALGL